MKKSAANYPAKPATREEQEELFNQSINLAYKALNEMRVPYHMLKELEQETALIVWELIYDWKYDPSRGCKWSSYVYKNVKWKISRAWQKQRVIDSGFSCGTETLRIIEKKNKQGEELDDSENRIIEKAKSYDYILEDQDNNMLIYKCGEVTDSYSIFKDMDKRLFRYILRTLTPEELEAIIWFDCNPRAHTIDETIEHFNLKYNTVRDRRNRAYKKLRKSDEFKDLFLSA